MARARSEDEDAGGSWATAFLVGAAVASVLLSAYLIHELVGAFVFPVGPDGPVYTWWIRAADALGLGIVAPGRAGIPAATLVLGTALGTTPVQTVMLLGPLLATATGLAAAAVVESALGPRWDRAVVAALLTGTFAAYLAGGWLANAGQAALFIAALAALVQAERSWRAVWLAAALLLASVVTHAVFAVVGVAILGLALLPAVPDVRRDVASGRRPLEVGEVRVALATLVSAVLAGLALLTIGGGIAVPGDTSQDGFLRRTRLTGLLRDRYRERLGGDLSRMVFPLTVGAALAAGRWADPAPATSWPARFLRRVHLGWAILTAVGVVVLALTAWGPANRLLVFAFVVPLGGAVGAGVLLARRRPVLAGAVAIAVVAFGVASMYGWYRQAPSFAPEELAAAVEAGEALRGQEPGTPVVFVLDTSEPAAAFHITRFANVIRMGLPPELVPTTWFVVGSPADIRAGRPGLTGDPEHDRISRTYFREARPILRDAWVLVLQPFNPSGFAEVAGDSLGPSVAIVRGPPDIRGRTTVPGGPGALHLPRPVDGFSLGLSGAQVVFLTAAALGLLFVLGLGWAGWGLPGGSRLAVVCLAPAAGLAVSVVAGFVTDRLAPGAASPWGLLAAGVLAGGGYLAAGARRNRPPRT